MSTQDAFAVFDSLTARQHETLALAATHMTSKQIAIELGLAPVTIDKRIDVVRARLGNIARTDLLRLYSQWIDMHDRAIDDPIILAIQRGKQAMTALQPADRALTFADSLSSDFRQDRASDLVRLRPGLRPSDLGVGGKLLCILGGAVAMMVVAVLSVAFANALMSLF